jgi:hypothetical protein
MKKTVITTALSFLAGIGLFLLVGATPASAWVGSCPNGIFCAWSNIEGTGSYFTYPYSIYGPVGECTTLNLDGRYGNDYQNWESVWNRYGSGLKINTYKGEYCAGFQETIFNGYIGNLWYKNIVVSFKIVP